MAWYNNSWNYRVKVTIDHTKVGASLTDYPVYVDMSNLPAGFFSNVRSDGGDIRVTASDGMTEVPRQVVFITTGSSIGELHFKASGTLSSSIDTDFYLYYGNAAATEPAANATYGSQNVWNSTYLAVYHLQEAHNTTSSGYKDSTANANHGTGVVMTTAEVNGKLAGKAAAFNGSTERITTPQILSTGVVSWSITGWMYVASTPPSSAGSPMWYQGSGGSDLGTEVGLILDYPSASNHTIFSRSGGAALSASSDTGWGLTTWYHVGATFSTTTASYYQNGASQGTGTVSGSAQPAQSGALAAWYAFTDATRYLPGRLDEIRITNDVKASTWVSTEYNNQNAPATFYTVAVQESLATPLFSATVSATAFTIKNTVSGY